MKKKILASLLLSTVMVSQVAVLTTAHAETTDDKIAAQDNKEILDLLGIKDGKSIISILVIGYPDVTYQRTTPRKEASINWI